MLSLFRNRLYLAVVTGHFAVDVLNSVGPVLLAVLVARFGLANAEIGLAYTLYTFTGSLSQPLFGWLVDRFPGRPTLLGGVGALWMAVCFAVVAFAQSWLLLVPFFVLAALGSGLFHPIGTASSVAAHRSRAGSATAVFFLCGQLGLAFGPVLGGWLFGMIGAAGIVPLSLALLLPAFLLLTAPAAPPLPAGARSAATAVARATGLAVVAFVALVALRSSIQATYQLFLPKLFLDRGWEPATFGALAGAFMFTAAFGNVVLSEVAERVGVRNATVITLLLAVPAGLLCLWAPTPAAAFVGSALAGLLFCGQHSILVVHAQRLLPTGQSFAAGLILGFNFAAGGLGAWLSGVAADSYGLLSVMQVVTLLGIPTALLALTLPGRMLRAPAPAPAKA